MIFSESEIINFFKETIKKIKTDDVKKVLENVDRLSGIFKNKYLKRFINDFRIMTSMLKDYWSGDYRDVPWGVLAAIVAALLYVLSPVDLIPDIIPVIGFIDDAVVMAFCLNMVGRDINDYENWKKTRSGELEKPSEMI